MLAFQHLMSSVQDRIQGFEKLLQKGRSMRLQETGSVLLQDEILSFLDVGQKFWNSLLDQVVFEVDDLAQTQVLDGTFRLERDDRPHLESVEVLFNVHR